MPPFEDLSRGEGIALVASLLLVAGVFCSSAYVTFFTHVEHTIQFEVFETNVYYYPSLKMNQTQVLTNGTGKFYFIGTWDNFDEGHTYNVTYIRTTASRPYNRLIILDWEEI